MSIEDLWLESPEVQDTSKVNECTLVSKELLWTLMLQVVHYGLCCMNFSLAVI